jgi:aminopeptidase N
MLAVALVLSLSASGADSVAALMGPGVSRELASYRAASIRNVRYTLSLDLTRLDTASGRVVVRFDRSGDGDVVLDFRGPALANGRANGAPLGALEWNGSHVRVPASALRPGPNEVAFEFRSLIAAAGASIIRYRDATDGKDYLYTLLVPSDANQLFPCFDQPDLKARVSLSLSIPAGWTAVANGALATSGGGADARQSDWRFRRPSRSARI